MREGFAYSLPISVADKQVTMDDLSDFIDSDWSSVSSQPLHFNSRLETLE
jgi:hypothetical protein